MFRFLKKKPDAHIRLHIALLVPTIGIEPTTHALRVRCSTN